MKTCINKCTIKGDVKTLEYIKETLDADFSMHSILPINKNTSDIKLERIINWGTEEDMSLITSVYDNYTPQKIDLFYYSDMPNISFLRRIAEIYSLEINSAYYDSVIGYVGNIKLNNKLTVSDEYEENPLTEAYKQLVLKNNFEGIHTSEEKEEKQVIISMKDLLNLKGENQ